MARRSNIPVLPADASCCAPVTESVLAPGDAEEMSQLMAALGDPIRLRLFSLIAANGATCSCDLEGPLERSQPTISHHTRILAEAGLIDGVKQGRWTIWSVNSERLATVRRVLGGS